MWPFCVIFLTQWLRLIFCMTNDLFAWQSTWHFCMTVRLTFCDNQPFLFAWNPNLPFYVTFYLTQPFVCNFCTVVLSIPCDVCFLSFFCLNNLHSFFLSFFFLSFFSFSLTFLFDIQLDYDHFKYLQSNWMSCSTKYFNSTVIACTQEWMGVSIYCELFMCS